MKSNKSFSKKEKSKYILTHFGISNIAWFNGQYQSKCVHTQPQKLNISEKFSLQKRNGREKKENSQKEKL